MTVYRNDKAKALLRMTSGRSRFYRDHRGLVCSRIQLAQIVELSLRSVVKVLISKGAYHLLQPSLLEMSFQYYRLSTLSRVLHKKPVRSGENNSCNETHPDLEPK